MRLKLKFDCQYGFKELYMTETDLDHDVDVDLMQADYTNIIEGEVEPGNLFVDHLEDIYEQFKTRPLDIYEETANSDDYLLCGNLEMLEEIIREDAYHNIFKELVDQYPGYFKLYNCRLELIETDEEPIISWADDTVSTISDLHKLLADKNEELVKTVSVDLTNMSKDEAEQTLSTIGDRLKNNKPITETAQVKVKTYKQKVHADLNSKTVCAMLNISRQTLANWVKLGKVHRLANGKYNNEEIKSLIAKPVK